MMCLARSRAAFVVLILASLTVVSCNPFSRIRPVKRGTHPGMPTLLEASKPELIRSVSDFYNSINSFSLECRLVVSTGSVYKGQIKDYSETMGYIDFRKPSDIRVVGLLPIVSTIGLHMVSDGKTFKVSIPAKSRFYEGDNDAPSVSTNKFENIRPEMFLAAMLVKPVDPENDLIIKVDDITEEYAYYQVMLMKELPDGELQPSRRITFDRVNLYIIEEREYAPDGSIVSLSHYGDWGTYKGVRFPNHIDISRPKEEIAIELNITKMDMNAPIADTKFVLTKPEGFELKTIGKPGPPATDPGKAHP
jgi:outer membrane lipoprotein-sorting protein